MKEAIRNLQAPSLFVHPGSDLTPSIRLNRSVGMKFDRLNQLMEAIVTYAQLSMPYKFATTPTPRHGSIKNVDLFIIAPIIDC